MKDKIIQSFTIKGLFGLYDVHIPFENDVTILIGENGMGKTQIMNLLYFVLGKKIGTTIRRNFDAIEIKFENNQDFELSKEKVDYFNFEYPERTPERTMQFLKLKNINDSITHNLNGCEIIYLPTYRRVEEDPGNLFPSNTDFSFLKSNELQLNFGDMRDVKAHFNAITQEIDSLSKEGLSKISSEVLSELINGDSTTETDFLDTIDENDIDIILARVGDDIDPKAKDKIRRIVATKNVQNKDSSSLYFLKKLVNAYGSQRELDNSIKTFRDICNKYLINKTLVYDESKIDIYVKINANNERLHLNDLSFGEKQIISIFSKIYLSPPDSEFIVLIDEPELSLSIFWQRNFLPDIYNSGKVRFLFAVTHSPFIFENELDKYAVSLNEYIKPAAPAQIEQPV